MKPSPKQSTESNEATESHDEGFHSSIWPILQLNLVALLLLSIFCVLFITINGGIERFTEFKEGLDTVELIIVSYFGGIGTLTLIAASWLAWLSGPTVFIDPDGVRIESTWLMDKTFPERHHFKMDWDDMENLTKTKFLTMRYLKIKSKSGKPTLYLPLFIFHKKEYLKRLKELAPKTGPLFQFLFCS